MPRGSHERSLSREVRLTKLGILADALQAPGSVPLMCLSNEQTVYSVLAIQTTVISYMR